MKPNEYIQACLDQLIPQLTGLTITGGVVDNTGEYWGFTAKGKQNGKTVEKTVFALEDPEGNGPGWLEINDSLKPEPQAFTEWCPNCSTEVAYKGNKPFPCSTCGERLLPCFACYTESESGQVKCSECPWESKGKEKVPCHQH